MDPSCFKNGQEIGPEMALEAKSVWEPILDRCLTDLGTILDRFVVDFWIDFLLILVDVWWMLGKFLGRFLVDFSIDF